GFEVPDVAVLVFPDVKMLPSLDASPVTTVVSPTLPPYSFVGDVSFPVAFPSSDGVTALVGVGLVGAVGAVGELVGCGGGVGAVGAVGELVGCGGGVGAVGAVGELVGCGGGVGAVGAVGGVGDDS